MEANRAETRILFKIRGKIAEANAWHRELLAADKKILDLS
jgi:hypothetical protein